ncbi:MAG: hypothetical protein PUC15_00360 [Lentisphaeria bacterium]|nr:hypothetical protein [Lentisphaeria bacterium]
MQDLIFYVAANETLGAVRDYANMRNESAPTLVLGVSACLRMRLFTERNVAMPYPISAFSGIAAWNWSMDGDYDRSTTCKLTADAGSITVHSVTDCINGETMTFTEFVIPISTMNTEELTTWLGTAESKRGLTGELVGYDTDGNAVFVLQIENFTVRNRVAGIGEPTSQNQELVTRTEAQSMIQYAISGATIDVSNVTSAASAGYAVSAGALTAAAMTTVVNSAAGAVTSVSEAGIASSLTAAAKADILASAGGSGGSGTIIYSGGTADYASSAGSADRTPLAEMANYAMNAGNADELDSSTKQEIISAAVASAAGAAGYAGPFAVTTSGTSLKVAGGRMYLGGAEYAVGSTTLTSSNGTVYYYVYYSSGSYYSGCSVAASASALAAVIRGSQGYYTALANVQGGSVTQCHYGDIRIDGRVS